ncbi:MAG TPA: hypothetical protein VN030_00840 [Cellvibrio sp.]|nr:hypothetical protein [Cellvibrio sp.]
MALLGLRLCFLLFGFTVALAQAQTQETQRHYVVDIQILDPERQGEYIPTLLKMILNASKAPNETIDFIYSDRRFSQARWFAEVERNNINSVIWTVTTKEREALLRPIRVPIFKGLLGHRIFVIRKEDQPLFSDITNIKDLSTLRAGQGIHWPDTDIMEANGLPVILGAGAENLYKMLKVKRFDYFPRGILELMPEDKHLKANEVVPEEDILLSYPSAMYFFVNKRNTELAERLEKGWEIIYKNGEFDRFFFSHPRVVEALAELKKHKRRIIRLENPYLPAETPLERTEYWLDVTKY